MNPAVWEISGHIVLKRREDYEAATEEYAWKLLAEVSLSEERFNEVKHFCLEASWKEDKHTLKDQIFSFIPLNNNEGLKLPEQSISGKKNKAKNFTSITLQETVV